jgi:hypothetical protein
MSLLPNQTTYQWNYFYILMVVQLATVLNTAYNEGMNWYPAVLLGAMQIGNITLAFMLDPPRITNEK